MRGVRQSAPAAWRWRRTEQVRPYPPAFAHVRTLAESLNILWHLTALQCDVDTLHMCTLFEEAVGRQVWTVPP